MLYLEHKPGPPLDRFVRILWYTRAANSPSGRERVLPTGRTQVIVNLARDFLLDCTDCRPSVQSAPAQIVGARSVYELIDASDMADLIGIVFEPGGFPPFVSDAADLFSNRNIDLEDVWGVQARSVRHRLREIPAPHAKLRCLESFLLQAFSAPLHQSRPARHCAVSYALRRFAHVPSMTTVADVARSTGWSERRFTQIFREQVGLTPKVWCRLQRFQRAVEQLHAGVDVPWSQLALNCGFYDQSHFANEFRAFSGVDISTYSARRTQWANHIRSVDSEQ